jgi:hypothetical protein
VALRSISGTGVYGTFAYRDKKVVGDNIAFFKTLMIEIPKILNQLTPEGNFQYLKYYSYRIDLFFILYYGRTLFIPSVLQY